MANPNSRVVLLRNVPLDKNQTDTIWFRETDNESPESIRQKMANFFLQFRAVTTAGTPLDWSDMTFQRINEGHVKVPMYFESLDEVNYIMINNNTKENRWYYGFIDRCEYLSDRASDVYYSLDPMMCYQDEMRFSECFVNRIHTESDRVGEHTLPENLEMGPYIFSDSGDFSGTPAPDYSGNFEQEGSGDKAVKGWQMVFVTPETDYADGVQAYGYRPMPLHFNVAKNFLDLEGWLKARKGNTSDIVSAYMVPDNFVDLDKSTHTIKNYSKPITHKRDHKRPNKLGSYTPKNKKLLTYPYMYLTVSNCAGTFTEYRYEDYDGVFKYSVSGSPIPGQSLVFRPGVPGLSDTYDVSRGMSSAPWPTIPIANDSFAAWLAQHKGALEVANMGVSFGLSKGLRSIASGMAYSGTQGALSLQGAQTGSAKAGAGLNTAFNIINTSNSYLNLALDSYQSMASIMATKQDASAIPDTVKAIGINDINYETGDFGFKYFETHIKPEYARCIDDFFTMNGYEVNRKMRPRPWVRPRYCFLKTVGETLAPTYGGNGMPDRIRQMATALFNKGIRLWRYNKIGNVNNLTIWDYDGNEV